MRRQPRETGRETSPDKETNPGQEADREPEMKAKANKEEEENQDPEATLDHTRNEVNLLRTGHPMMHALLCTQEIPSGPIRSREISETIVAYRPLPGI